MNKFRYIFCFIVFLCSQINAHAQLLNVRIGSDALVEDAIKGAVVMVESKYCVQDVETNQKYGRNGKPYFNTIDFLGCRTDEGVITSERALTPWAEDNMFDKYRDNSKYRPLLDSTLVVKSVQIDSIQQIDISTGLLFNNDSTIISTGIDKNRADGLMVATDDTDATHWIIWIKKSSKNESKEASNFEYNIIKKSIEFTKGDAVIDTPNSTNSFIGGFYITAKVVSVGLVEFSLSGFIIEDSGRWVIKPINTNIFSSDNKEQEIISETPNVSDDSLTPVKENGKEKKKKSKANKRK